MIQYDYFWDVESFKLFKDYTQKKPRNIKERDEIKRQIFMEHISQYPVDILVYIDESVIDKYISSDYG